MRRRALVMGSEIAGLSGVSHDLEMTEGWLSAHGFEVDARSGAQASRDGMLDGIRRLIRDSRAGDAAVIYYSGHGGYVYGEPERVWVPTEPVVATSFQYLVPTDHESGTRFRGIFRAELSLLLRDLSEETQNITVVLDCCHSDDMLRDHKLVRKLVVEPWSTSLEEHLEWLQGEGYDLGRLSELRNPFVVLLAACSADESAYEYTRPRDGKRCGVFTNFLLEAAYDRRHLDAVTWEELMGDVAARVERRKGTQRPQRSGPVWRRVFSEEERRDLGALRLAHRAGRWSLYGGSAVGLEVGDRYEVIEADAEPTAPRRVATVVAVQSASATLDVAPADRACLRSGMLAVPHRGGPARAHCRVHGSGALAMRVQERLREVAGLGVLEGSDDGTVEFMFRVSEDELEVLDASGAALRRPFRFGAREDPRSREERLGAVADLARLLAHGARLRRLRSGHRRQERALRFSLEWGAVDDGVPRPHAMANTVLSTGDQVYVKVENAERRVPIYASVLDIGVGWDVSLLTGNQTEGVRLGLGDRAVVGQSELRELRGLSLHWPEHVPAERPLDESLVVVVSNAPLPVGFWSSTSTRSMWGAPHRDLVGEASDGDPIVYDVAHVRFQLCPPKADDWRMVRAR